MKFTTKLQTTITFFSALFCLGLNAQKSTIDFDLSDYQLPYLKRQTLELDFDLYGSSHRNSQSQLYGLGDGNQESLSRSINFSSSLKPVYYFYLNTPGLQLQQYANTGIRWGRIGNDFSNESHYQINNDSYTGIERRGSTFYPQLDYSGEFREFLRDKFFIEQDLSAYYESNQDNSYTNYLDSANVSLRDQTLKDRYRTANFAGSLLLGWGRIERVEDARLAVYILDDLKKAGRLSREVNDEDIIQLAESISRVQNARFFDSREKEIWEMETIDSVLQDLRLITTEDMIYYTRIKDNWDYANGSIRESGFMLAAGLTLIYANSSSHADHTYNYFDIDSTSSLDTKHLVQSIGVGGVFRQRYEKSLNLYWQLSLENRTGLFRYFESDTDMDLLIETTHSSDQKSFEIRDDLYIQLSYYPNSRTKVSFYSNSWIYNTKYTGEDISLSNVFSLNSQAGINLYYYFSPQLRFTVQSYVMTRTDKQKYQAPDNNRHYSADGNITARITYKFL